MPNVYDNHNHLPSLAPPLELRKRKLVGRVANLRMNYGRQFVVLLAASILMLSTGCAKKKPQLPAQAKAPAPTIEAPLPPEISETVPPPPPPTPTPEPAPQTETAQKPVKHHNNKKKPPTTTPGQPGAQAANPPAGTPSSSNTTVAAAHPPGNPAETQPDVAIAADVTNAQLVRQKQSTAQLIEDTEKTISGLKNLSHDEEEMLTQIRSYVSQSRKATSDGDFERAYNLATKAHLLTDALVKK